MIFGYLFCLIASGLAGGLTLVIGLCDFPLWLDIILWGAAVPLYLLIGVIYGGGLSYGFKQIFGKDTTGTKDA